MDCYKPTASDAEFYRSIALDLLKGNDKNKRLEKLEYIKYRTEIQIFRYIDEPDTRHSVHMREVLEVIYMVIDGLIEDLKK